MNVPSTEEILASGGCPGMWAKEKPASPPAPVEFPPRSAPEGAKPSTLWKDLAILGCVAALFFGPPPTTQVLALGLILIYSK